MRFPDGVRRGIRRQPQDIERFGPAHVRPHGARFSLLGPGLLASVPGRVYRCQGLFVFVLIFVRVPGADHACRARGGLSSDEETEGSGSENGRDWDDWNRHGPSPAAGIERSGRRRARTAARLRQRCAKQRTAHMRQVTSFDGRAAPQSSASDAPPPHRTPYGRGGAACRPGLPESNMTLRPGAPLWASSAPLQVVWSARHATAWQKIQRGAVNATNIRLLMCLMCALTGREYAFS